MMFKRPRLSTPFALVNARSTLAVLFVCTACGSPKNTPTRDAIEDGTPIRAGETLSLPAVWNTSSLSIPLTSVGLAGAWGSRIALTNEQGSLQFFDFEAEQLTAPAAVGVREVGDGLFVDLAGTGVTLFPAIQRDGNIQLYIHAGELDAPVAFNLDMIQPAPAAGLCSGAPDGAKAGLMQLAYWTDTNPYQLITGRINEAGDTLSFIPDTPMLADAPITACLIGPEGAMTFSEPIRDASALERNGLTYLLTLDSSGNLQEITDDGSRRDVLIRDGLSVFMPARPVALASTGDARTGGYPGGLVVMVGEVQPGDSRAVLIDPSPLTLSRLPEELR